MEHTYGTFERPLDSLLILADLELSYLLITQSPSNVFACRGARMNVRVYLKTLIGRSAAADQSWCPIIFLTAQEFSLKSFFLKGKIIFCTI